MAQYLLLSFNQNVPPQAHGKKLDDVVKAAVQGNGQIQTFPVSSSLASFTSTDQLMSVADDLAKNDIVAYGLASRAARNILDLAKRIQQDNQQGWTDIAPQDSFEKVDPPQLVVHLEEDNEELHLPLDQLLKRWKWNETMFTSNRSVDDMFRNLVGEVNRSEEDLRTASAEFTEHATRLQNLRRKNEGTLLVRSLDQVGSKMALVRSLTDYKGNQASKTPIYVDTAHLTTILVVVKNTDAEGFEKNYDLKSTYVVPNSCQKLEKDNDYTCYAVTLMRTNLDDYKTATKEKGWHIREFKYNPTMREDMKKEASDTIKDYLTQCEQYKDLLESKFSHLCSVWLHLKALRIFVESKLLYGIPTEFRSYLVEASMKSIPRIHRELEKVFGDGMDIGDDDAQDVENEYHPYVSFQINLNGLIK